jgi:rubrerythrin
MMVLAPTRIEKHEVWYCPKCGFMDIEGGGMNYE